MKFYKDSTTGLFHVGRFIFSPSQIFLRVDENDKITISYSNTDVVGGCELLEYTDFKDETDTAYVSLDAFLTAAADLIAGSPNDLIEAITTSGGSQFKTFEVEITRPSNTTAYTAGDVVADVSAAFLPLLNVAKATGTGVKIIRCRIQTDDTGVAGKKFNLHLYKEAPTFIADNAAFAISYANATKRKGAIPIVMGTGSLGTVGMNDYNPIVINPTARDIFYILESVDAFTPSANSTKFTICIDCELSN
jgi:hypothetical protein